MNAFNNGVFLDSVRTCRAHPLRLLRGHELGSGMTDKLFGGKVQYFDHLWGQVSEPAVPLEKHQVNFCISRCLRNARLMIMAVCNGKGEFLWLL